MKDWRLYDQWDLKTHLVITRSNPSWVFCAPCVKQHQARRTSTGKCRYGSLSILNLLFRDHAWKKTRAPLVFSIHYWHPPSIFIYYSTRRSQQKNNTEEIWLSFHPDSSSLTAVSRPFITCWYSLLSSWIVLSMSSTDSPQNENVFILVIPNLSDFLHTNFEERWQPSSITCMDTRETFLKISSRGSNQTYIRVSVSVIHPKSLRARVWKASMHAFHAVIKTCHSTYFHRHTDVEMFSKNQNRKKLKTPVPSQAFMKNPSLMFLYLEVFKTIYSYFNTRQFMHYAFFMLTNKYFTIYIII